LPLAIDYGFASEFKADNVGHSKYVAVRDLPIDYQVGHRIIDPGFISGKIDLSEMVSNHTCSEICFAGVSICRLHRDYGPYFTTAEKLNFGANIVSWSFPRILERHYDVKAILLVNNSEFFDGHVRPQLALSSVSGDFYGILSGFSGILGGFDKLFGVLPAGLHFLKLAVNDQVPDSRDKDQSRREAANMASPFRHSALVPLVIALGFLFLGFCSALAAQKNASYAEDHGFPWWIPFFFFIGITYFSAYQGLHFLNRYDDAQKAKALYTDSCSYWSGAG
jgi:hypothetical protein